MRETINAGISEEVAIDFSQFHITNKVGLSDVIKNMKALM